MAQLAAVRANAALPRRPAKSPRRARRTASIIEAVMNRWGTSVVRQPNQNARNVM
jgi:hypothetical protein